MIYLDVMSEIAMVRYVVNNNIHHACTELRKKIASSAVVVVGVRRRRRGSSWVFGKDTPTSVAVSKIQSIPISK